MTIYLIDFNMTFKNSTDLMILTEKPWITITNDILFTYDIEWGNFFKMLGFFSNNNVGTSAMFT
jgi:hypothetical protein